MSTIEDAVSQAVIEKPEVLGYAGAVGVRELWFGKGLGRLDALLVPSVGPHQLVAVEVKDHTTGDARGKVVGQLLV